MGLLLSILLWIVAGIIVGRTAKWTVPGEGPGGIAGDTFFGIVGAIMGGWIYSLLDHVPVGAFKVWSVICAVLGALILLWIIRAVSGRRTVA